MIPLIVLEKFVALAVMLCAIAVGFLTIHHGDLSLGLLVLLGQAQTFFGNNHTLKEAAHIIAHKSI